MASARAPGDADRRCTDELPTNGGVQPAPLPANAKVLVDSYDYILLLPRADGGVWQQVDLDDNNDPGRGTEVSTLEHTCMIEHRSLKKTHDFSGVRTPTFLADRLRLSVGLRKVLRITGSSLSTSAGELVMSYCLKSVCKWCLNYVAVLQPVRELLWSIYETSTENSTIARETDNYRLVSRVDSDDDTGQTSQNQTRETDFNTAAEGFYIAIRDETTCIVLQRLIVFYNVCPGGPGNLVMRPETIAPPVDRMSQPLEVTAQCVEGASPDGEGEVRLNCNQGGVWNAIPGSGCSCDLGFNTSADRRSCIGILHQVMYG